LSENNTRRAITPRKIIGLVVSLIGVLTGAALSSMFIVLILAYWGAPENKGIQGNLSLGTAALFGALIGYGIYRLGRRIAG
jgi:energy-converting hydrogenase Eha subunit B